MVKEIIWSPLAIETYDSIIEYLLFSFGNVAVKKFVEKVDERLKLIATRPQMFRPTNKHRNTYMTSLQRKVTIIYRYKPYRKQIELVVFWGRQNPKRRPC
jgi:plasmid stabilization system protein ParE